MVRRRKQDRSLFEVLLPDSDKLWPAWLKRIDTLLEDEAVSDTVASALERRWPKSRTRGREGTPAEVVLRMLILKHLHDWSFDVLEHEVRANLVYRAFARIGVDAVPDAKTILKIAKALGPDVITDLHRRGRRRGEAGGAVASDVRAALRGPGGSTLRALKELDNETGL
jgi:IS5 family transposase